MKTEWELINDIKLNENQADVSDALNALIEKHSGIYMQMAKKYLHESADHVLSTLDAKDEMPTFFWETALEFDESKGCKFSSFVGERAFWNFSKSQKKRGAIINIGDDSDFWDTFEGSAEEVDNSDIISEIKKEISLIDDPIAKQVMELRYSDSRKPMSWKQIGDCVGRTYENCRQIHKACIEKIKENLLKKNLTLDEVEVS